MSCGEAEGQYKMASPGLHSLSPSVASRCMPVVKPAPKPKLQDKRVGLFHRKPGGVFQSAVWAVPWLGSLPRTVYGIVAVLRTCRSASRPATRARESSCQNQGTRCKHRHQIHRRAPLLEMLAHWSRAEVKHEDSMSSRSQERSKVSLRCVINQKPAPQAVAIMIRR